MEQEYTVIIILCGIVIGLIATFWKTKFWRYGWVVPPPPPKPFFKGGVITTEKKLTDEEYEKLKEDLEKQYKGSTFFGYQMLEIPKNIAERFLTDGKDPTLIKDNNGRYLFAPNVILPQEDSVNFPNIVGKVKESYNPITNFKPKKRRLVL